MDIIPIQSLPAVSSAAPAAARAELVTTRAIEFHPHEQDATYTPSHGDEEQPEHKEHLAQESYGLNSEPLPETFPDEPREGTISLFA